MKNISNLILSFFGIIIGALNGLFGAGGGIAAVEVLKHFDLDQKEAQTTSIAVILPLCVLSASLYMAKMQIDFKIMAILIPFGLLGAFSGTIMMKKFSSETIKKIFCFFIIYAGLRMIWGN
ncbi:MAG: sulfite exporter TauE/SafE family protein [Clostridia bacterium]|nr:sulfite exporter TauE/SafE family protein [Clostridia bacterium]